MRTTDRTRLVGLMLTSAMFATAAYGQTPTTPAAPATTAPAAAAPVAAPAANTDVVEDVTVTGQSSKSAISATQRVLKVDAAKASSCNFSVTADNYIEDFIAATTRTKNRSRTETNIPAGAEALVTDSTVSDPTAAAGSQSTYFSATNPSGVDASSDAASPELFTAADSTEQVSACTGLDRNMVAGRREIARLDKDLPAGYAAFEQKKYAEALAAFTRAFKKLPDGDGGKEASLMIGKIHLVGVNGKPNAKEAAVWLAKAANAPFNPSVASQDTPAFDPEFPGESLTTISDAALILAKMNLMGEGIPKDPKAARKWYERANYVGFVPASKTLGDMYFYGYDGQKDIKKAVDYYTKGAVLGYAPSAYSLAEIYYYGDTGVEPNLSKALGYYQAAAKIKNVDAQSAMGSYFYEGTAGVAKDNAAARQWFEAAAGQGQKDAMFNLAVMQMKGEGGPKDLVKSWVWFRLAKARGYPNTDTALAAIEKQMSVAEKQAADDIISPKKTG